MYDDLINIRYPFDLGHKRMSKYDRCSQFMPFSALTGYKEAVLETARITSKKVILDDEIKELINSKLNVIKDNLSLRPDVTITYFVSDSVKTGGSYKKTNGFVKKIDLYNNIIFIGNNKIVIDDIVDIEGCIFDANAN